MTGGACGQWAARGRNAATPMRSLAVEGGGKEERGRWAPRARGSAAIGCGGKAPRGSAVDGRWGGCPCLGRF